LTEVARLRALTDELYIEIRETISGLRSDVQQKGFVRALRDYLERFEELHGLRVTLQADPIADVLPLPTAVYSVPHRARSVEQRA
jgi:signal transduction histidine kinase